MTHITVLPHESIDCLNLKDGDVFIDATLGNGGHSAYALSLGKDIRIVGIDQDEDSIARAQVRLGHTSAVTYVHDNFRNIDTIAKNLGIQSVNAVLFDFGFSSDQIEQSGRGFSFQKDEPLLMTFKKDTNETDITAYTIVNTWEEDEIKKLLWEYADERFAPRIARAIVAERKVKTISTTTELVDVVKRATPAFYHRGKIHPATRTFQAIRIAVNDELGVIRDVLPKALELLTSHGVIATISFHSLEDRIVKHTFRAWAKEELGRIITKRPQTAGDEELQSNPRSRSAKLRIFEKK